MEGDHKLATSHLQNLKDIVIPESNLEDIDSTEENDPNPSEANLRKNMIHSSKILLGRYIIIHKGVAISFAILHSQLFFVIFFKIFDNGVVESEGTACFVTWPLMHIAYMILNWFLSGFFLMNYMEAVKCNLSLLQANRKVNTCVMLFSGCFQILKLIADLNCRVWKVSWGDCGSIVLQVLLECVFINYFYDWLRYKISVLKYTLAENLDQEI